MSIKLHVQCHLLQAIPAEGIKIVGGFFHSHLAGSEMRMRHFRNGQELPLIFEDKYYDFNFQHFKSFPDEVIILPGDDITLECQYDTSNRNNVTLSGIQQ